MANVIGELLIRLGLDASSLSTAIGGINKQLNGLARDVQRDFGGIQKSAENLKSVGTTLSAAITLPIVGLGAAAVKSAADIEALKLGLTAVTGSATVAEKQFQELREVAKLPGLGLKEAAQGATNLQALGFSANKSKEIMLQFGNALATVGRGREDLGEVIRQLGQLASRGQVTADNLKPIIERVPQVASIIKREFGPDALGAPAETFKKLGVSAEDFINTLLRELGKLARVTGGAKNDFENFSDTVEIAMADIGKAILPLTKQFIDVAVPAISGVAGAFTSLSPELQRFLVIAGGAAAIVGPSVFAIGQMVTVVTRLRFAMLALGTVGGGPVGLFVGGLAAIGAGLWANQELSEKLDKAYADLEARQKGMKGTIEEYAASLHRTTIEELEAKAAAQGLDESKNKMAATTKILVTRYGEVANPIKTYTELTKEQKKAQEAAAKAAEVMKVQLEPVQRILFDLAKADADKKNREIAESLYAVSDAGRLAALELKKLEEMIKEAPSFPENSGLKELEKWSKKSSTIGIGADLGDPLGEATRQAEEMDKANKAAKKTVQDAAKEQKKVLQQVSTIVNDLSRDIARSIVQWKGFGEAGKTALRSISESLIRYGLDSIFLKIGAQIKDLIVKHLPGLAGALGKIFGAGGIGNPMIKNATDAVGGVAGQAGSAAGGTASAAAGGLTGIFGAIGSIGSMVTGIIGNFQNARQENTLNAIEHEVRYSQIHLSYILEKANEFWPRLADLAWLGTLDVRLMAILGVVEESREILRSMNLALMSAVQFMAPALPAPGNVGAATGGLTINFYGPVYGGEAGMRELTDKLITSVRQRGGIKN